MVDFLLPIIGFAATSFAVSRYCSPNWKGIKNKEVRGCINTIHNSFDYWSFIMGRLWHR